MAVAPDLFSRWILSPISVGRSDRTAHPRFFRELCANNRVIESVTLAGALLTSRGYRFAKRLFLSYKMTLTSPMPKMDDAINYRADYSGSKIGAN